MTKRRVLISAAALLLGVLLCAPACARKVEPGDPLPGLAPEEKARFEKGKELFNRVFTPETGLGPLFNAVACGECHEDPVAGGPGDEVEVHVAAVREGGVCDPLIDKGGPVIQQAATPALRAALGIDREPEPAEATGRAQRTSPDVLGFGLLDAVPEEAILAYADPDDKDGDGISGRPNRFFDGRMGRFGRKALVPTLREFNDGAFVIEQGVTNPAAPDEGTIGGAPIPPGVDPVPEPEIDQEALDLTDAFVRLLAPPQPKRLSKAGRNGRDSFTRIGCAACHVPELSTADNPIKALSRRKVAAYTDLLLHDMGPELADICFGEAQPSEFRTEPLMGMSLSERFLHDGRAATIEEAVRLHGGEATASRDRFAALTDEERKALLEFLESL
jgi:CxxC motif-containing protein (DUF1111 family)